MKDNTIINEVKDKDNYTITNYYSDGSITIINTVTNEEVVRITSTDNKESHFYTINYNGEKHHVHKISDELNFNYKYDVDSGNSSFVFNMGNEDNGISYDFDNEVVIENTNNTRYYKNLDNFSVLYRIDNNEILYVPINDYTERLEFRLDDIDYQIEGKKITITRKYGDSINELIFENNRRVSDIMYDNNGDMIESIEYWPNGGGYTYKSNFVESQVFDYGLVISHYNDGFTYQYYNNRLFFGTDSNGTNYIYNDEAIDCSHITINEDGTMTFDYYEYNDEDDEGHLVKRVEATYEYDENNKLIAHVDGRTIYFDKYFSTTKIIEPNGDEKTFNFDKLSERKVHHGKVTYSKINHIEYDEDEYDNIMRTMVSLYENSRKIESNYNNIISTYKSYEYNDNISENSNLAKDNVEEIDTLKKAVNYSLLTYQTCDNYLVERANILVDKLFDDNDSRMVHNYLDNINNTVEDRDGDQILEYKSTTNFKCLFNTVIPCYDVQDKNGNILYFTRSNRLIDFDGEDMTINHGNQDFTVDFSYGYPILHTIDGNNVDIFGDYNMQSIQYGGDQSVFMNTYKMLNDPNIVRVLDRYFPNSSEEERAAFLCKVEQTGCGYIAFSNVLFKRFEGREEEFFNTFGYPMYDLYNYMNEESLGINYNYEPLALELYCQALSLPFVEGKDNSTFSYNLSISDATKRADGFYFEFKDILTEYVEERYGIHEIGNYPDDPIMVLSSQGFDLYEMNGTLHSTNGESHLMYITGVTADGNYIVSSWGEQYYVVYNYTEDGPENHWRIDEY